MTDNRPYQLGEIGGLLAIGIGSRDGNILCERRGVYASVYLSLFTGDSNTLTLTVDDDLPVRDVTKRGSDRLSGR